jgi:hypothetical protein
VRAGGAGLVAIAIGVAASAVSVVGLLLALLAPAVAFERAGFYLSAGDATAISFVMEEVLLALVLLAGMLISVRLPGHRIGWLMLGCGSALALVVATQGYTLWAYGSDPVALPGPDFAAWLYGVCGGVSFVLATVLLVVFPTGRPLSPTWSRIFGATLLACIAATVMVVLAPGPLSQIRRILNPFGVEAIGSIPAGQREAAFTVPAAVLVAICAASMIARYRRGSELERLQLRWVATAVALIAITFIALATRSMADALAGGSFRFVGEPLEVIIFYSAFGTVPIAIGIAVLRYRLYEIDRLISRTIGWAIVTGLLGAAFVVLVLGLTSVLGRVTGGDTLAVASSTLVVAALFSPARSRVQGAVDRRFDRSRYDGERLVAAFGERLRDEVDLATITTEVLTTVDAAVRPSPVGLWLRERQGGGA